MDSRRRLSIMVLLSVLALCASGSHAAAEPRGQLAQRHRAGSKMSGKALENTNSQWSADPERGWVRADERHDLHEQRFEERERAKGPKTKALKEGRPGKGWKK
ncbi:MAG TPA: hypothetical protein VNN77_01710 [candidate division Zixibacteria bacterium]|nr:hypothetical protein [candidate division Zixibacteria bacterium]